MPQRFSRRHTHYPLGETRSGMARYAEAMRLYQQRLISAETLEVLRICAPDDALDPLGELERTGVTADLAIIRHMLTKEQKT